MRAISLPFLRHALRSPRQRTHLICQNHLRDPAYALPCYARPTFTRSFAGSASPKPKEAAPKRKGKKENQQGGKAQPSVPRRRLNRATGKVEEQRSDGSFVSVSNNANRSRPRKPQDNYKRGSLRPDEKPGKRFNRESGRSRNGQGRFGTQRHRKGQGQGVAQRSVSATRGVLKAQNAGTPQVFDTVEPLENIGDTESDDLLLDDLGELEELDSEAETFHRLNRATGNIELVDSQGEIIVQDLDTLLEDPEDSSSSSAGSHPRSSKR